MACSLACSLAHHTCSCRTDLPFSSGKPGVSMQLIVQRILPKETCEITTALVCESITAIFSVSDAKADFAVMFLGKRVFFGVF